ncbi:MAG: DUF1552 domain-containing protein, partial [Myxococcota bacterium]|nr:DUF1552 domain-containing protein [Myxococcota bacterium]
ARTLRRQLGVEDRRRLEAHIEHLDTLQRQLGATGGNCEAPPRPADEGSLIERAQRFGELLSVALSCGLTRCFSVMLTSPASTHIFSNVGVSDGMHKACHDGDWEGVRAITLHQMEAFAAFLDGLDQPLMGGGQLLDRGCVYGTSEYGEGWHHGVRELPVVIAGGAAGRLQRGVHLREARGNLSRAQLTTLQALGLPFERFGWNGGETDRAFSELL